MLVAISIPIFTAQLEKSRAATDAANIRSAYAEVTAAYLGASTSSYSGATKQVAMKHRESGTAIELPSALKSYASTVSKAVNKTITVKIDGTGAVSIE